jgi:hypothetical protein
MIGVNMLYSPTIGLASGLFYIVVNMVQGRIGVTFLASATWQTSGLLQTCRLQLVECVKTARAMR